MKKKKKTSIGVERAKKEKVKTQRAKRKRAKELELDKARDHCESCKGDCKCKIVKLPCVGFVKKES